MELRNKEMLKNRCDSNTVTGGEGAVLKTQVNRMDVFSNSGFDTNTAETYRWNPCRTEMKNKIFSVA